MICPNCAQKIGRDEAICPHCGEARKPRAFQPLRALLVALSWVVALAVLCLGAYKLYFWIDAYKLNKLYTRGAFAPSVTEIILNDGRAGHAIVYYGRDGDAIFFDNLDRTVAFSGGVARLEVPDSFWFGPDIESVESAEVSVAAMLLSQNGDKRLLPPLSFEVIAPESPIKVISPEADDLAVNTSIYILEAQVVPGSAVTVNGRDYTDTVDQGGHLSVNVNVYPVGENKYSIIVDTPNHKQARRDVVIYRAQMEIGVEVLTNTATPSSSSIITISGKCDPGAVISVDSDYVEESLGTNLSTGEFSFIAKLSVYGKNTVRFRASMDGKADSVISLAIDYRPTLEEYSARAWAMDQPELSRVFEQRIGQEYKCVGEVVDVVHEGETQYVVMDVGPAETRQLVVLENLSNLGMPARGGEYIAWADVSGRHMYESHYYPKLIARFIYTKTD